MGARLKLKPGDLARLGITSRDARGADTPRAASPGRRVRKPKTLREKEKPFQDRVIDLAHLFGYRVAHFKSVKVMRPDGSWYHVTPVGADGKGYFDLTCVRGKGKGMHAGRTPRLVHLELKREGETQTPEQLLWQQDMLDAGQEAYCFWPKDFEEIRRVLE